VGLTRAVRSRAEPSLPWFDGRMRVLFSTTAGAGHFGPMVPIAKACLSAGHEVAVAAPASFDTEVRRTGLDHLPFPDAPADQMGAAFGRVAELSRLEGERIVVADVFGRLDAQAALPTLIDIVREWRPQVVVRDPCEFASLVVAARAGVPQAQVAIGLGRHLAMMADWLDAPLRELEQLAGLDDPRGVDQLLAAPTFTIVPAELDDHAAEGRVWRFRTEVSVSGPALPAEWGDATAPLVYVSFGSVAGSLGNFDAVYPAVLRALSDLPVRVLLTTGSGFDPARLDPLPANAWATEWWPQAAAMREAALVIGHGGFGTTMTAVAAGVPQLVLPLFASDQFLNAERIEAAGAGMQLLGGLDALPEVPRLVEQLLDEPGYAVTARRIAAAMAALPDVGTTVRVLEELASS